MVPRFFVSRSSSRVFSRVIFEWWPYHDGRSDTGLRWRILRRDFKCTFWNWTASAHQNTGSFHCFCTTVLCSTNVFALQVWTERTVLSTVWTGALLRYGYNNERTEWRLEPFSGRIFHAESTRRGAIAEDSNFSKTVTTHPARRTINVSAHFEAFVVSGCVVEFSKTVSVSKLGILRDVFKHGYFLLRGFN